MGMITQAPEIFKPIIIGSDELRKIPVNENGEALVDTKNYCPDLRFDIASYITDEKERNDARFVRKTLAEMINKVFENLPQGYGLILRCGLRSLETQKSSFDVLQAVLRNENPDWSEEVLNKRLDECVAPIDIAPHCTGGAIDIFLCDEGGSYIDTECEPSEHSDRTYTYSNVISEKARDNRALLITAFSGAGFTNFPGEIWHWSYGDYDWAAYQNKPATIYGPTVWD